MPKHVVKKYRIYTNGRDASGDYNRVDLKAEVDELESTTVNSSGDKSFQPGLKAVRFEGEVFASHGDGEVEDALHALLAAGGKLMSVYPSETAGDVGYAFEAEELSISPAMKIGDLSRITIKATKSGGALVRVTSMEGKATKTATGTGTARQLGAGVRFTDHAAHAHRLHRRGGGGQEQGRSGDRHLVQGGLDDYRHEPQRDL
jgi:hypothetical protein